MRPGNHETIPTVSEVVREATAISDPNGEETAVLALFETYEDDDRPATAAEDLLGEMLETAQAIDPEGDDPAVHAAAATAAWLSTNPGQRDDHEHVLREGVRLAFGGSPPAPLANWLAERGVEA